LEVKKMVMDYQAADSFLRRQPDPIDEAPAEIRQLILEARSSNALGVCGIKGCGQELFDSIGCKEHAQHATDAQRLESRMQRLVLNKRPRKRYY
jgi:hypothetical protein